VTRGPRRDVSEAISRGTGKFESVAESGNPKLRDESWSRRTSGWRTSLPGGSPTVGETFDTSSRSPHSRGQSVDRFDPIVASSFSTFGPAPSSAS